MENKVAENKAGKKAGNQKRVLPPVIRVFISSTFADMEGERSYFNAVTAPKLRALCENRGISFFSVDLRWGITEEDQMSGQVLPICLREIDSCRPFFIGIVGNRYGSTINQITPELSRSFPWVQEYIGKSVTELEMLYGVLDTELQTQESNCLFLMRSENPLNTPSNKLSKELPKEPFLQQESPENQRKLQQLRERIKAAEGIPSREYASLEEMEKEILTAFGEWLDRLFPAGDSLKKIRENWYNQELLRNYMDSEEMRLFTNRYCEKHGRTILIYGEGARGKTAFLTNWIPEKGEKILINCESDHRYQYWPEIAYEIIGQMNLLDETVGYPEGFKAEDANREEGYQTDEELEAFRSSFMEWMQKLQLKTPVTVVVNDLELAAGGQGDLLNFFPVELPEKLQIICSGNQELLREKAEALGWNSKEMQLISQESARAFMEAYLGIYGKKLSRKQEELLCRSVLVQYPGYLKFLVNFLNLYGRFDNLDQLAGELGRMDSIQELYGYVLKHMTEDLDEKKTRTVAYALAVLSAATVELDEEACYEIVSGLVETDALTWAQIHGIFEVFGAVKGDYWIMRDPRFHLFAKSLSVDPVQIHTALGVYYMGKPGKKEQQETEILRRDAEYFKGALIHFSRAKNWDRLLESLHNRQLIACLSKLEWRTVRMAWMNLFLYTDRKPGADLLELHTQLKKEGVSEEICRKIVQLLYHLECYDEIESLPEDQHLKKFYADEFLHQKDISPAVREVHDRLLRIRAEKNYVLLQQKAAEYLERRMAYLSPQEIFCICELKLDAEVRLRMLEEGLKTAGTCLEAAQKIMNPRGMINVLEMYGQCLYFSQNPEAAKKRLDQAEELAASEGLLRPYLSVLNMQGLCLKRMEKTEEALQVFDKCIRCWDKLHSLSDKTVVQKNAAILYVEQGEKQKSLEEFQAIYKEIQESKEQVDVTIRLDILHSIGALKMELEQFDEAEKILKDVTEQARGTAYEQMLEGSYRALIALYRRQNLFDKEVEIRFVLLEKLYKNRRYTELAEEIKDQVEELYNINYIDEAVHLKERWRRIFDGIPGGKRIFQHAMENASQDEIRGKQLEELLKVAQSEGDAKKCGEILEELADLKKGQSEEDILLYLRAAKYLQRAGETKGAKHNLYGAVYRILCRSREGKEELLQEIRESFSDRERKVLDQWCAALRIQRTLEFSSSSREEPVYSGLMNEILDQGQELEELVFFCLLEQGKYMTVFCEETVLEKAALCIKEKQGRWKRIQIEMMRDILEKLDEDTTFLKRRYRGEEADQILQYDEKMLRFLRRLDENNSDIDAMAGNIALIFRRRRDREKTYFYHRMSMEGYRKAGKMRDCYIEALNLATACQVFEEIRKTIDLLRETLKEEELGKYPDLRAAIAGNLAHFLMMQKGLKKQDMDKETEEEIVECFRIEEGYFSDSGAERELAISLLNQTVFLMQDPEKYGRQAIEKFLKAREIVARRKLTEFQGKVKEMGETFFSGLEKAVLPTKKTGQQKEDDNAAFRKFKKKHDF